MDYFDVQAFARRLRRSWLVLALLLFVAVIVAAVFIPDRESASNFSEVPLATLSRTYLFDDRIVTPGDLVSSGSASPSVIARLDFNSAINEVTSAKEYTKAFEETNCSSLPEISYASPLLTIKVLTLSEPSSRSELEGCADRGLDLVSSKLDAVRGIYLKGLKSAVQVMEKDLRPSIESGAAFARLVDENQSLFAVQRSRSLLSDSYTASTNGVEVSPPGPSNIRNYLITFVVALITYFAYVFVCTYGSRKVLGLPTLEIIVGANTPAVEERGNATEDETQSRADLIVMRTLSVGRRQIGALVLGSETEHVCPRLITLIEASWRNKAIGQVDPIAITSSVLELGPAEDTAIVLIVYAGKFDARTLTNLVNTLRSTKYEIVGAVLVTPE